MAWTLSEDLNRPEEGLKQANEALLRIGWQPNLLDTRGVIEIRLGQLDDAIKDLEEAAAALPTGPVYFHLARAFQKKGRMAEFRASRDRARQAGIRPEQLDESERRLLGFNYERLILSIASATIRALGEEITRNAGPGGDRWAALDLRGDDTQGPEHRHGHRTGSFTSAVPSPGWARPQAPISRSTHRQSATSTSTFTSTRVASTPSTWTLRREPVSARPRGSPAGSARGTGLKSAGAASSCSRPGSMGACRIRRRATPTCWPTPDGPPWSVSRSSRGGPPETPGCSTRSWLFSGRSAACGIPIQDRTVARTHAALFRTEAAAYVINLSTHRTWIDDRPVRGAAIIHDGQVLTLGSARFVVSVEPPPGPPPRPSRSGSAKPRLTPGDQPQSLERVQPPCPARNDLPRVATCHPGLDDGDGPGESGRGTAAARRIPERAGATASS